MNRVKDWLRFIFISVECLYALIIVGLYLAAPEILAMIGQRFHGSLKVIDFTYAIPGSCLVASLRWGRSVLFPDESLRKQLKRWPDYRGLVDRVKFAWSLMLVCSVGAIAVRLLEVEISDATRGMLTLLFCGEVIVTAISLFNAWVQLKMITDEFGSAK